MTNYKTKSLFNIYSSESTKLHPNELFLTIKFSSCESKCPQYTCQYTCKIFAVSVFNCTHYNSLIWCSKIRGTFISKVRKNYISDKFYEITAVGAMTLQ